MCLGVPRARDLVHSLGTILLWGGGIPFSHPFLPPQPVARVVGKTFGSAWTATALTSVIFDQVFAYLFYIFYNLVYLAIFQLLRASSLTRFY
jgi:hypothetical protein